jgi:hypothetical protein
VNRAPDCYLDSSSASTGPNRARAGRRDGRCDNLLWMGSTPKKCMRWIIKRRPNLFTLFALNPANFMSWSWAYNSLSSGLVANRHSAPVVPWVTQNRQCGNDASRKTAQAIYFGISMAGNLKYLGKWCWTSNRHVGAFAAHKYKKTTSVIMLHNSRKASNSDI